MGISGFSVGIGVLSGSNAEGSGERRDGILKSLVTRGARSVALWVALGLTATATVEADGDGRHSQTLSQRILGDVVSAGVGLLGSTSGSIALEGIPEGAQVETARLYWTAVGTSTLTTVTLNGVPVSGTLIGTSARACQNLGKETYAYRATVNNLVSGNGDYELAGFPALGPSVQDSFGAALVVIYSDPSGTAHERDIVISDGSVFFNRSPPRTYSSTLTGFAPDDPVSEAKLTFLVGDGQAAFDDGPIDPPPLRLNGLGLGTEDNFVGAEGSHWDTTTFDVASYDLTNPVTVTMERQQPPAGHDCLHWVATILSITAGGPVELDYGDAPESYSTLLVDDGARHQIDPTLFLGFGVDAETDGQPDPDAMGDDQVGADEQGVTFVTDLFQASSSSVVVTASQSGMLDAWVDFDLDGDWDDPSERVFEGTLLAPGPNALTFEVPATANLGDTYARFRFSRAGGLGPQGIAADGEVEDHAVEIRPALADLRFVGGAVDIPDPVSVGEQIVYQMQVTNAGPSPAQAVDIVLLLPAQVSNPEGPEGGDWMCDFQTGDAALLVCTHLPQLVAGGTTEPLSITVEAPGRPSSLLFNAGVSATTLDPNPTNNFVAEVTTVLRSWTAADPLLVARRDHTATLLPSGRVLVTGGRAGAGALEVTELFSAEDGSWHRTGDLEVARSHHSALLLPEGEILVVGGYDSDGNALDSIERYDPETGSWTLFEPQGLGHRARHTTTLMNDGRVLVVGGCSSPRVVDGCAPDGTLASVRLLELQDNSVSVSAVGSLSTPRAGHSATLLPWGQVLVVGGWSSAGDRLRSLELYDPADETWAALSLSLSHGRADHTTTVLGRFEDSTFRVLVAGGTATPQPAERINRSGVSWSATLGTTLLESSSSTATVLPSGQVLWLGAVPRLWDPEHLQEPWSLLPAAMTSRSQHTATLLPSGKVLVVGGCGGSCTGESALANVEVFRTTGAEPRPIPVLSQRAEHTATLLPSGQVLLVGGADAHPVPNALATTTLFDRIGGPTASDALATPRRRHTATLLDESQDQVVVIGGVDAMGQPVTIAEIFDGTSWSRTVDSGIGRYDHTATRIPKGDVLVVGGAGANNEILGTVQLYDPAGREFAALPSLSIARKEHSATVLASGKILVAGGQGGNGPLAQAEIFDPISRQWSSVAPMAQARAGHTATLLPSGKVLVVGGEPADGAELYDPEADTWSPTQEQPNGRSGRHTATLLPSGQVLVFGQPDDTVSFAEVYDPITDSWDLIRASFSREFHTATLLSSGEVLVAGGYSSFEIDAGDDSNSFDPIHGSAEVFELGIRAVRRPAVTSSSPVLSYSSDPLFQISGDTLRGDSETAGGKTSSSAADLPMVRLQSIEGDQLAWLSVEELLAENDELRIDEVPPIFNRGWHLLSIVASGVPSEARLIRFDCGSLEIVRQPVDEIGAIGDSALFSVDARGGRNFQWQRCLGDDSHCADSGPGWVEIPEATRVTYATPPLVGPESGTRFRVSVDNGCLEAPVVSASAVLRVLDEEMPEVRVTTPTGGEYWALSTSEATNIELVGFEVSDPTTWVCDLRVSLIYSDDGGETWSEASANPEGELPARFDSGEGCLFDEAVASGTLTYTVPHEDLPPSGQPGSLYKIRLDATDHAGNTASAESTNPFFIVAPNDESIKTLILANPERQGLDCGADPEPEMCRKLRELADHPQVAGIVVDLGLDTDLEVLFDTWDEADEEAQTGDTGDRAAANDAANAILFDPTFGIQQRLRRLLAIYPAVESVMLIGGDSVLPMARVPDRSGLLLESEYTRDVEDPDLVRDETRVARALAESNYLSDDPLVTLLDPVRGPGDLKTEGVVFIPDLMVGRLVETPEEIVAAIANFQEHEGVLELHERSHKVLVTGYDFLIDSANLIAENWRCTFDPDDPDDPMDSVCAPVASEVEPLIGTFSQADLQNALCGRSVGGTLIEPYGLINLNGHATHFLEGIPGENHFDIDGLDAAALASSDACGAGAPLDLGGAVIYAVGCHGGLPVDDRYTTGEPPTLADTTHGLDLPQVFLQRGALAYIANSGYGWGLKDGIGYGERLLEIFTDQMRIDDSIEVGEAVRSAKLRYYQEARTLDAYGIKTLMQWTTFGFPMARFELRPPDDGSGDDTGQQQALAHLRPITGSAPRRGELAEVEQIGPVTVRRSFSEAGVKSDNPPHLDVATLGLDFSSESWVKRQADGTVVPSDLPGCPDQVGGCYYTLNGLGQRGSGETDQPIQPYIVYDSRLAGTSQHGVLWLGGNYVEEAGWRPIFAELISNGEETGENHGSAPQMMIVEPIETPLPRRSTADGECRVTDLDLNTTVVPMGEVRQGPEGTGGGPVDPALYKIQRRYTDIDLEFFYFNQLDGTANCDREGPVGLEPDAGPFDGLYHVSEGSTLHWQVPLAGPDEGNDSVWRVVVVYDARDTLEAASGSWDHLDLTWDSSLGAWTGSRGFQTGKIVTYVIQAVDTRGNVSWMRFVQEELPPDESGPSLPAKHTTTATSSGVDPRHPAPVKVAIEGYADLAVGLTASPDPVVIDLDLDVVITVSNLLGPDTATNLVVDFAPFPGSRVLAAGGSSWSCVTDIDGVHCRLPSLAVGESSEIAVFLEAPPQAGDSTAEVSVRSGEDDTNPTDNHATATVTVIDPVADLALRLAESVDPVVAGTGFGNLQHTLEVENLGPDTATGLVVGVGLPLMPGVMVEAVLPSVGAFDLASGAWTLGELSAGGVAELLMVYTVDATAVAGTDAVATFAVVASMIERDPEIFNNIAYEATSIYDPRGVDLGLELVDRPDPVATGAEMTLEVQVSNLGPGRVVGHGLTIELPDDVTLVELVDGDDWGCTTDDSTMPPGITCSGFDLAESANAAPITLNLMVPDSATVLEFLARVDWTTWDPAAEMLVPRSVEVSELTVVERSWSSAPSLLEARSHHATTLLPSGELLVSGGWSGDEILSSVEIYDPAIRRWRSAAPLGHGRFGHASLLLPDGGVVVVGGTGQDAQGDEVPLRSVERYDPQTGSWNALPALQEARRDHTLTLLVDGSLLAVGGVVDGLALETAETLAPGAASWVSTADSNSPRTNHTATLLNTGEVLVVGGGEYFGSSTVELYDPAAQTWRNIEPMALERLDHTATLLSDGRVLVVGDSQQFPEIYDPGSETWSAAAPLFEPRSGHSATLLADGRVLVAGGGIAGAVQTSDQAEVYDPVSNSWTRASDLEIARDDHTATLLPGGQVVLVGGDQIGIGILHSVEILGGPTARRSVPAQSTVRAHHAASLLPDGSVLVTGGTEVGVVEIPHVDRYLAGGTWTAEPSLTLARESHAQTLLADGRVLVTGGYGLMFVGQQTPEVGLEEVFDPNSGHWTAAQGLEEFRRHHTATLLPDGTVLIVGGEIPNLLLGVVVPVYRQTTVLFDPSCDCLEPGIDLPAPRARHTATLLPSGRVLVAGGENTGGLSANAYLYDPMDGGWTEVAPMNGPRSRHAAVLLPSGRVLVAGGEGRGAEVYDPESDTWLSTGAQPAVRSDHPILVALPSGLVLLVGTLADGSARLGAQIYDPVRDSWSWVSGDYGRRSHTATLLADGRALILGGEVDGIYGPEPVEPLALLFDPVPAGARRPTLTQWPSSFDYLAGSELEVVGDGFRGVSEGSGGATNQSSTAYPLVQLQALNGGPSGWLQADPAHPIEPGEDFWDGSMTLDIASLPPVFHPGWHRLTVFAGGVPSHSEIVELTCSLEIGSPQIAAVFDDTGSEITGPRVPVGGWVRFEVTTRGGRQFRWQRNTGSPEQPSWIDVPGATDASYTTPPLLGLESGSEFRVEVSTGCTEAVSEIVSFTIDDQDAPAVSVTNPNGGEHWPLSTPLAQNVEQVVFEVTDPTTWVCGLRAALIYSNDQGATWHEAPPNVDPIDGVDGELPRQLGEGQGCSLDHEVLGGTLSYEVPLEGSPPSGQPGSLYKIRLLATDHAGNTAVAESSHPFFIVPPDDQSVRTLILFHPERLGVDCGADPEPEVCRKVRELADNPQVAGRVVDLGRNEDLEALYTQWDAADQAAQASGDQGDRDAANQAANAVLFAPAGLQEVLLDLVAIFGEVESVMLIGDDRVIPMARVPDRSGLLGEQAYTHGADPDLAPNDSTVGRAIDGGFYLSDDPLMALVDPVRGVSDVVREGVVFLPDLAVGRLVESPEEIAAAIANFQQREGTLDLVARSKKVLVTGYDFLTDSARSIEEKWRCAYDRDDDGAEGVACDPLPGTIDASLLGQGFGQEDLRGALCADGEPYGLLSLNGHATHFLEGVPGETHFDIQGLETETLASATACDGQPLDLEGAVIYAVGCHGGLSVPDDSAADGTLDLPQVLLGRGALAYIANSGYGWGLREGIGYGERMQEIFTDQLRVGDSVTVGRAVLDAKRRYFQEARGLDAYGIKTLMQWTTYGFPMARIDTGLGAPESTSSIPRPIGGPAPQRDELPAVETVGPMTIYRSFVEGGTAEGAGAPDHLDRGLLTLAFSEASYVKRTAEGDRVPPGVDGCPSENGCYYTLNGLGERGTGDSDRPIQPFTVYDSRLAGTSQHGVLWLGGEYREEEAWRPIFAALISNGEDTGSNHGSAPQMMIVEPIETPFPPRELDAACRVGDLETNTMVLPVGEVRQGPGGPGDGPVDPASYDIQRRYLSVDVEMLYFNNFDDPAQNCDREGPTGLESGEGPFDGAFHTTHGATLEWRVPVDDPSGVWRVVVVYDARDTHEAADGAWQPLELVFDPLEQAWTGSLSFVSGQSVAYVLQAVDNRGNVSWLRFGAEVAPPGAPGGTAGPENTGTSSGVDPEHAAVVGLEIGGSADLAVTLAAAPNPVAVGEPLDLIVDLAHQGGDPATAVEVEILPFPGSMIVAVGDAQWSCGTDGDRILCDRSSLAPGASDQIVVSLVAPPDPGPRIASVWVRSAESDPDGDDNQATVGVTVVEPDLPPRVARVDTAARVADGPLEDGVAVDVALTQLRVVFDEPVSEAEDPDHFLLVEAGGDGILQTESLLLGLAGDDVSVSFDEVTYEPETRTTVLGLPGARPLPRGRYLLLVGNGIYDDAFQFLDGDGDGDEGDDFQRFWWVERQHRVVNPNFDRSLAAWDAVASPNGAVEFRTFDSEAIPSSGSVAIQHFGGLPGSYAIGTCIPVHPGERLAFGAQLRREAEDPWEVLELHAEVWSSANCGETPLNQAATEALEVEPGDDGQSWVRLPLGSIEVPEGGGSLLLALVAAAGDGAEPAEIGLDNVEVYPLLFADGFETGDTSRWSRVVGQ